jgi:hypothetical protein
MFENRGVIVNSSQAADEIVKNSENWVLAVLGILGTVFVTQTFNYRFSAALFPRIVNIVLASLCFYRLGKNMWRAYIGRTVKEQKVEEPRQGLPWYWSFFITVLYFGMVYLIGFIWATGLFLLTFPIVAGYRRWGIIIIVAVATAIFTEIGFSIFLQISLPEGILFTRILR